MSAGAIIELVAAVAILGFGIWLYRRNRSVDRGYGSQGAVLLFAVAAIMGVHALGLMEYRPSKAELEVMRGR
jgi:hypothetical protein